MKFIFTLIAVLSCAIASAFPEDPSGVDVIDRAFKRVFYEGEELVLYFTLFNSGGRGTVKIDEFRYGEWETIYTWNPKNLGDEFMVFNNISVLSVYDLSGTLQVSWIDRVEYHEGLVTFYLKYNYLLDEWEEGWVD